MFINTLWWIINLEVCKNMRLAVYWMDLNQECDYACKNNVN